MIDLTFFTSNMAKFSNAKHILRRTIFNVVNFRERTYHKSYEEPRLRDRDVLLDKSYESALAQARRANILSGNLFFFLEDTSVEIMALSAMEETPGVDIKYWMRDHDFSSVDRILHENGNNRNVIVRSHVVLHVPDRYEPNGKMIFTSEQRGRIVEKESVFDTNLVYPWLDNRTFNKWFSPEGADVPLGSMNISDADEYDFRKGAITKMADHVGSLVRPGRDPAKRQLSLPLREVPCYIVCGYSCAGKTSLGQHLIESSGYLHVEASDYMHLAYRQRHGARSKVSMTRFALEALRDEPTIAARGVLDYLAERLDQPWVVTGFRSNDEVEWFSSKMIDLGIVPKLLFIDAAPQDRFERMVRRSRRGDTPDRTDFDRKNDAQREMGLEEVRNSAMARHIVNEGCIEDFLHEIDSLGHPILIPTPNMPEIVVSSLTDVGLEDAILFTLLQQWSPNETSAGLSTTSIAKRCQGALPLIQPRKHKDNISRYFNQYQRAYYDYICDDDASPLTYSLSNTGYSQAISRLKALTRTGRSRPDRRSADGPL